MDGQAVLWFAIGVGAACFGLSLLYQRYVKRTPTAVQSGGSFTMFAILMFLFALGAIAAGVIASA